MNERHTAFDAAHLRLAVLIPLALPFAAFAQADVQPAAGNILATLLATVCYAGFAAALLLNNLLQYLANRDRCYLVYAGFALGTGISLLAVGLLHGIEPGGSDGGWTGTAEPFGLALAGVSAALFNREYLRTATLSPRLDLALKVFTALFGIALAGVFVLPGDYPNTLIAGISPAFALLAIACAAHGLRQRLPGARLLIAGWTAMLIGAILFLATHTGLLRAEGWPIHAIQFVWSFGALTMSLALAERTGSNWREGAARHADELASLEHSIETLQASEQLLTQGMAQRSQEIESLTHRLQESERRFQEMAHHDALTGLANQLLLTDRIDQGIIRAKRHNTRIGVVMLDLDEFSSINDSYGQHVGDEILKIVAQRLRSIVREQDTVARPENDQFVIVLEEVFDMDDLQRVANAVTTVAGESIQIEGQTFMLDVSMGSAISSNEGANAVTLLKQAGKLMRRAKEGKRLNRQHGTARSIAQA
ncbi:diguanylate cyclase [Aromatoleum evansii]|uniref:Diguanylate cyclase n=1 Tax=Aromatoleum evansii TaxID=59406 RepID=A0ABZ1AQ38_AROEV|nr:diguanylate cyclase [Aromatoleum evansii]WRL46999.1 diguanylate cyclase [Aromatoleum evansii]